MVEMYPENSVFYGLTCRQGWQIKYKMVAGGEDSEKNSWVRQVTLDEAETIHEIDENWKRKF